MTSRLFGMVFDLIFSDCSATSFGCFSAEWCSIQNHRILIFENSFLVVFLLVFHCWSSNWCVSGRFLFCVSASSQVQYAGKKRFFDQSKRWLSSLWFERIVILVKQRWMHCAVGRKFIVVFQKMKHRINVTFLLCWLFGCLIAFFVFSLSLNVWRTLRVENPWNFMLTVWFVDCWFQIFCCLPGWWLTMTYYSRCSSHNVQVKRSVKKK